MNKQLNNKSGFTLIEIIIVVIIIGVLAAVGLPKLTAQTTNVKAAESQHFSGVVQRSIGSCIAGIADMSACDTLTALGVASPTKSYFDYVMTSVPGSADPVVLKATLKASTQTNLDQVTYTFYVNGDMGIAPGATFQGVVKTNPN